MRHRYRGIVTRGTVKQEPDAWATVGHGDAQRAELFPERQHVLEVPQRVAALVQLRTARGDPAEGSQVTSPEGLSDLLQEPLICLLFARRVGPTTPVVVDGVYLPPSIESEDPERPREPREPA